MIIYITGETALYYSGPANYTVYTNADTFNITLYFNDTARNQPISGASINIEVNGSSHIPSSWYDYGNGYYNITIDCGDPDFSGAGSFGITFNVSKQNYYWQIKELIINVSITFNSTDLIIQDPPNLSSYNSGETFNITFYYNDTTANQPISGAIIDIDVNGTYHTPLDFFDYLNGIYEIEINCSASAFNGYGWFAIRINATKIGFMNQSKILTIKITGETDLSLINPSNYSIYNSANIFDIRIYFNDTAKDLPLSTATINVDVNGSLYSPSITNFGNGYYNLTIDCSNTVFNTYGWFGIRINISLLNYYPQSKVLDIKVIGLTQSLSAINLTQYGQILTFNLTQYEAYLGENITIYMNFRDFNSGSWITGALGIITFNSVVYNDNDLDLDGIYSWELNTSLLALGSYQFIVNFTKSDYQSQELTINFRINKHHAQIAIISQPSKVKPGETFELILQLYYVYSSIYPIDNANITLLIEFGNPLVQFSELTNSSGLVKFTIPVPQTATKIEISLSYNGTGSITTLSLGFSITLELPSNGNGTPPPPDMMILIIIIIIALVGGSLVIVIVKKGGKGKTAKPAKAVKPVKAAKPIKPKGKPAAGPPKPIPVKKPKEAPKGIAPQAMPKDLRKELLEAAKSEKDVGMVGRDVMIKPTTATIEPDFKTAVWAELKTALAAKREQLLEGKKPETPSIQPKVIGAKEPVPKKTVVIKDEEDIPTIIREEIERVIISIIKQDKPKTSEALIEKVLEITKLVDISITESRVKLIIMKLKKENQIHFFHQQGWSA